MRDRIKAEIKKYFSNNGFEKINNCFLRPLEKGYYLVACVFKDPDYTYLDKGRARIKNNDCFVSTGLPFYDIHVGFLKFFQDGATSSESYVHCFIKKNEADVSLADCSLCEMNKIEKLTMLNRDEKSEEHIITELKNAFEKSVILPLFKERREDFSLYYYVVFVHKTQHYFPYTPSSRDRADMAFDFEKYEDAFMWLKIYLKPSTEDELNSEEHKKYIELIEEIETALQSSSREELKKIYPEVIKRIYM